MNKKVIIPTILFIVVLIFVFIILFKNREDNLPNNPVEENQQPEETQIILFYGIGCPHCAIVEDYIKKNNIKEKLSFEEKEVYYDQNNAKELETKAKICGLPSDSIGVPFLWDGSKCFIGDEDIIKFFKQKLGK